MSDNVPTNQELHTRLSELEAATAATASGADDSQPRDRKKHPVRTLVAILLILLGTLLTPVAIIGGWSKVALTDTDAFVATYAPLADDPTLQAYITDEIMTSVHENLDLEGIVNDLVDGLVEVVERPRAAAAIPLLVEPAIEGIRSSVEKAVAEVVGSDAFATAWEQTLRTTHTGAVNVLSGDPDSTLTITDEGLALRLGPIVEEVQNRLLAQGFTLASRIPEVDKTIVIVPSDDLTKASVAYQVAVALGSWLPLVALLLLVGGVAVSVHRHTAALWASFGLAVGALAILIGVWVGRIAAGVAVPADVMPSDVLDLFYDTTVAALSDIAAAALVLAIVIGVVSWLTGPYRPALRLRNFAATTHRSLTSWGDQRGISTGRFGVWMYAARVWLRVLVGLAAGWALLADRPLSVQKILGTAAVALLALAVLWLLARRPEEGLVQTAPAEALDVAQEG